MAVEEVEVCLADRFWSFEVGGAGEFSQASDLWRDAEGDFKSLGVPVYLSLTQTHTSSSCAGLCNNSVST